MTDEEIKALIRTRRKELDRKIAAGEVVAPKPLTYDKKGPPIRWVVPGATPWVPK